MTGARKGEKSGYLEPRSLGAVAICTQHASKQLHLRVLDAEECPCPAVLRLPQCSGVHETEGCQGLCRAQRSRPRLVRLWRLNRKQCTLQLFRVGEAKCSSKTQVA